MTQTYWEDHELLNKLSTGVNKLQYESDETIRKVTDDLMSQFWLQSFFIFIFFDFLCKPFDQLDGFDTALTRLSVDQEAEMARLAKSYENLRQTMLDMSNLSPDDIKKVSSLEVRRRSSAAERLIFEGMIEVRF